MSNVLVKPGTNILGIYQILIDRLKSLKKLCPTRPTFLDLNRNNTFQYFDLKLCAKEDTCTMLDFY